MNMLVLSRKVGEQICLPQFDIVLTVLEVKGRTVRLGIAAPKEIAVVRKELQEPSPRASAQAAGSATDPNLLSDGQAR
jgi:carbon storage regulator